MNIIQDLDRMGEQTLQLSMGNEQSPNLADLYSVDFTICRFIPLLFMFDQAVVSNDASMEQNVSGESHFL